MNTYETLAAVSLFRELYDSNSNKDVFDKLVNYVEGELGNKLTENKIELLKENFFDYHVRPAAAQNRRHLRYSKS